MKNLKDLLITSYNEKQLKLETNYIISKYFKSVEYTNPMNREKDGFYMKNDILINNIPYVFCVNPANEGFYIPKDANLFKSDFDDIYKIHFNGRNIAFFSVLRKQNGIIESESYDFATSFIRENDECVRLIANRTIIEDPENNLYKRYIESNTPVEKFIDFDMISDLKFPKKEKTVGIVGNKHGEHRICVKSTLADMVNDIISELYDVNRIDSSFEEIEIEKGESLIETAHSILMDGTTRKIRK